MSKNTSVENGFDQTSSALSFKEASMVQNCFSNDNSNLSLLTVDDVAELLRCSASTVRTIPPNELSYMVIGQRQRRYFIENVYQYFDLKRINTSADSNFDIKMSVNFCDNNEISFDLDKAIADLKKGDKK